MYIFASDPHATGQSWIDLVEKARAKYPLAKVVFGGDYIDGRKHSKETLDYVFSVPNAIILRGNHEQLLLDYVENHGLYSSLWFDNGGKSTVKSLFGRGYSTHGNILRDKLRKIIYYEKLKELPLIYETEKIIFVHAGVRLDGQKTDEDFALWAREDYWYIDRTDNDFVFAHNNTGKTIVSGHTPTCMLSGVYEQPFPKANPDGVILGDTKAYQCPVKIVKYDGEPARIFTDGGCHIQLDGHYGNVVVLDDNGALIEIFN